MIILVNYKIAKQLSEFVDDKVIALPPYSNLDSPVNSHADMLVSVLDNTIFIYKDYYEQNREVFDSIKKYNIIPCEHKCKRDYPNDIGLNVLIMGKKIFCNSKFVAGELLEYAKNNNYKIIDVKQGYSCCSTLAINENHAITSDIGMYKSLVHENISTLLITNNGISLEGYNCGFIGGSGGILNNSVIFFGNIKKHIDFPKIEQLIKGNDMAILSIFPDGVSDFGGFKVLEC
ncbi:MAG: hypothetical protein IJ400_01280 [Clostridia bacterium]|nr:hypothetical protein [Clostridia bacterium]